jgi:hypothetical protein
MNDERKVRCEVATKQSRQVLVRGTNSNSNESPHARRMTHARIAVAKFGAVLTVREGELLKSNSRNLLWFLCFVGSKEAICVARTLFINSKQRRIKDCLKPKFDPETESHSDTSDVNHHKQAIQNSQNPRQSR